MKKKVETSGDVLDGNTKQAEIQHVKEKSRRVNQLKRWDFVWNNYPKNWREILETVFQKICTKYCMQPEIGEKTGTPHIQGAIWLKKKMRWSQFNLPDQISYRPTRNEEALWAYCTKEHTKNGDVVIWPAPPKPIKLISELRPWQAKIVEIIKQEPDDRKVYWFWESKGNVGKSAFTKYLCYHYNALFCMGGKLSDLINLVFNNDMDRCNIIIFDIPRSHGNHVSYDTIESIKNGMVCNTKYETGVKLFNSPHVIVFANEAPEEGRLSEDRWVIEEIS